MTPVLYCILGFLAFMGLFFIGFFSAIWLYENSIKFRNWIDGWINKQENDSTRSN